MHEEKDGAGKHAHAGKGESPERGTMEIQFECDQVIVVMAKGVLMVSRQAFIAALKKGKAWRRRKSLAARIRPEDPRPPRHVLRNRDG